MRAKIPALREARGHDDDDNDGVELARESQRLIAVTQRLFSGRDGRIALTLVLVLTAALEASLYTLDRAGSRSRARQTPPSPS